jgi:hypothetical protein
MKNKHLPSILALAMVAALIVYFPPGPFSWRAFLTDQAPLMTKLLFLGKAYLVPAALSFAAVVAFRLQMGLAVTGVASSAVFPLALLASGAMMAALRSMSAGIGGVPGYALGMAIGYTLMSKIHGLRKTEQTVFGRPVLKVVWRSEADAVRPAPHSSAAA